MKHEFIISVPKNTKQNGITNIRNLTIRERMLRFLLDKKTHITVIVPGDSVE